MVEANTAEIELSVVSEAAPAEEDRGHTGTGSIPDDIGLLLSGIAHENQLLLTVMSGFLSFSERFPEADSIRKPLAKANELLRRLFHVNEQLRKVESRLRGAAETGPRSNVNRRIEEITGLLKFLIANNIVFKLLPAENIRLVQMPESQFDSILLNLVVAARQAMPCGGVITISTENLDSLEEGQATRGLPHRYVSVLASCVGKAPVTVGLERLLEGAGAPGIDRARRILKANGGWVQVDGMQDDSVAIRLFMPAV